MGAKVEIRNYLNNRKETIEDALRRYIPEPSPPFTDHLRSLHYSISAGGKRIRPILCLAAAETVKPGEDTIESLLPIACAIECIHTYSLIHDDLPAMDNDDLRRGKPTNHKVFGEAAAILAGDGLLTLAFELMSSQEDSRLSAAHRLEIIHVIAVASGSHGMVGGQALDIAHEKSEYPFEMLKTIHHSKTGALITASIEAGAIGGGADPNQRDCLRMYGNKIGLAFQIIDDLLNATSTTEKLGKKAGSDKLLGKATYPDFFGIDETRVKAQQATEQAIEALAQFGDTAEPLRALAQYINTRSY
jgi:geranylgeranyl diphosphate synthase type II